MGRLDPTVARGRLLVRDALADLVPGDCVLVAVSGGSDSLALATAAAFVGARLGLVVGAVVVDHALQPGSAVVADEAAAVTREVGLRPVEVVAVHVGTRGGPEGAARTVRRAALLAAAERLGARTVLLGHTLDDQAETVLLGLARGSGARSLAAMAPVDGPWRRPFLSLTRTDTQAICRAEGLTWWDDPHNADRAYARVRVRLDALPALEAALGPGVREALARTAELVRADADLLDALACSALEGARVSDGLDVATLSALAPALRTRVLRRSALDAGCPASDLAHVHVTAIDELVTGWHGQVGIDLPGRVTATRADGVLHFARTP